MRISKLFMLQALMLSLAVFALAGCDFNGGVEQGRCVAYDKAANTVTLVVDTAIDQHNPHYSGAIDTFKLPTDPRDMGPEPVPGGRLMVEVDKKQILFYNPDAKKIETMPITIVEDERNIGSRHPKLSGKTFPIIDKENHTITIYSRRLEALITFKPDREDAFSLPDYVWKAGDEVRIAFRNDKRDQAIRFMNVSKTNIFTR